LNAFDNKAQSWDDNPSHWERSEAIAKCFLEMVPVEPSMKAMEYGAGTGILSFLLSDRFAQITMLDHSQEMVKVMYQKVEAGKVKNLKPMFFDLELADFQADTFDCIFSQMVLHHISDTKAFFERCQRMLLPGGYLVVADLFTEDGSFHDSDAKVHLGFEPTALATTLLELGFVSVQHKECFLLKRPNGRVYPLFILVAKS
jgi:tRNA (cmo5U34)-methyltransferase